MFMSPDADILDRCQQVLAELVESDPEVVRHVKGHLLAQDTRAEVDGAMRSYARASRSLRQSVALTQKLARDVLRDGREATAAALRAAILSPPPPEARRRRAFPADIEAANQRVMDLRTAVRRLIWTEGLERSDVTADHHLEGEYYRRLEDWIHDERCEDEFVAQPLDDHIAEYAEELDLDSANIARWRDLPEPDAEIIRLALANHSEYAGRPPWHEPG